MEPATRVRKPPLGTGHYSRLNRLSNHVHLVRLCVAFNPQAGEVYGVSGDLNGYLTYLVPQFFERPGARR